MEFATLFYNRGVIINASREGARFGTLFDIDTANGYVASPKTDAEITQRVSDFSAGHLISFFAFLRIDPHRGGDAQLGHPSGQRQRRLAAS